MGYEFRQQLLDLRGQALVLKDIGANIRDLYRFSNSKINAGALYPA